MTPLFTTLVEVLGVPVPLAKAWWRALVKATWSTTQSWKRDLLYFDARPATLSPLGAAEHGIGADEPSPTPATTPSAT